MGGCLPHRLSVTNLVDKKPKRINYVNIQYSHTIPSPGYRQPAIRTEYEYVLPYKVSSLYAVMAKEDGQVIELTPERIGVRYKSNKTEHFKIGKQFGRMEGSVYLHEIVTEHKVGSRFKVGDHICYNKYFFEPDWLNPSRLVSKLNRNYTVALMINSETFEDSSAISDRISKEVTTLTVKEKTYVIDFKTHLVNLVQPGAEVNPNTVLFSGIDDAGDHTNLSEQTVAMLQNLAALSPRAKVNGTIERYEIKYNGDLSDMSPSLRKLATALDKAVAEATKGTDREISDNQVTSEYRSEGKNLGLDQAELKIFITVPLSLESGDKGVFANQMKSVASVVYKHDITTETGDVVDAMFSYKGVLSRILASPIRMGIVNRVNRYVSAQVADIYFGK